MTKNYILVPDKIWDMNLKSNEAYTYVALLGMEAKVKAYSEHVISDREFDKCVKALVKKGMVEFDDNGYGKTVDHTLWKIP
jgi:predicted DNA-binding transcriptional regulator